MGRGAATLDNILRPEFGLQKEHPMHVVKTKTRLHTPTYRNGNITWFDFNEEHHARSGKACFHDFHKNTKELLTDLIALCSGNPNMIQGEFTMMRDQLLFRAQAYQGRRGADPYVYAALGCCQLLQGDEARGYACLRIFQDRTDDATLAIAIVSATRSDARAQKYMREILSRATPYGPGFFR